ncbi:MAG: hypothetical protein AUK55_00935 [Syntrophobacteraceae bacterium CG2_30_61_12]|nr:MAG: hypothetical protein AUK55_00935 [Syntrophobacteraceae bacterium CG2_30_61_12]
MFLPGRRQLPLDPFPVALENIRQQRSIEAARHRDLKPRTRHHPEGHPPGPSMFPNPVGRDPTSFGAVIHRTNLLVANVTALMVMPIRYPC